MSSQIIGLQDWFQTPPGRYLLDWEQVQFDAAVTDLFGYHALQLGLPEMDALRANRMPHRWLAAGLARAQEPSNPDKTAPALVTDFAALPFPAGSLDLVVLPHALDAWIDHSKTRIGYEISFARYFYKPAPLRSLDDIRGDILKLEQLTEGLLKKVVGAV